MPTKLDFVHHFSSASLLKHCVEKRPFSFDFCNYSTMYYLQYTELHKERCYLVSAYQCVTVCFIV